MTTKSKRFDDTAARIKNTEAINALKNLIDGTVVPIPISMINRSLNARKARLDINDPATIHLMHTVKEVGLLQSPVVTILDDEIVCLAGHRRLLVMEALGHEKVPCAIKKIEAQEQRKLMQLIENTAREPLHPLDVADEMINLEKDGYSQTRLQDLLGKDRKTIGRFQKIGKWPVEAKKIIRDNPDKLKTGVLLQLASRDLTPKDLIQLLREKIVGEKIARPSPTIARRKKVLDKTKDYFKQHDVPKTQQQLVLKIMKDLQLV